MLPCITPVRKMSEEIWRFPSGSFVVTAALYFSFISRHSSQIEDKLKILTEGL